MRAGEPLIVRRGVPWIAYSMEALQVWFSINVILRSSWVQYIMQTTTRPGFPE